MKREAAPMSKREAKLLSERRLIKLAVAEKGIELVVSYSSKYDSMYLLIPEEYCSCASFYIEVFSRRSSDACIHLRALRASGGRLPEARVSWDDFKNKFYPLIFKGFLT